MAAAAPEDIGPYEVATSHVRIDMPLDPNGPEGALPWVEVDLYVPVGGGRRPLIELAHAWPGTLRQFPLSGWGTRLASNGYVVVIPDRRGASTLPPSPFLDQPSDIPDLSAEVGSEDMLRVLRWAIAQSRVADSPLYRKVNRRRLAIGGHSLGGYLATFAAVRAQSEGPRLSALLLLDPSDERLGSLERPGESSLPQSRLVRIPTLMLASEETTHPIQCNMDDGPDCTLVAPQQYDELVATSARLGLKVVGSVHEDIEDPSTIGTPESVAHLRLFQRYGMAWLDYWLGRDCAAASWLGGDDALADQAAGVIELWPGATGLDGCHTRARR